MYHWQVEYTLALYIFSNRMRETCLMTFVLFIPEFLCEIKDELLGPVGFSHKAPQQEMEKEE